MDLPLAIERLRTLTPGRHYGASAESQCWVVVGRSLTEIEEWSIVPPAASLTFVWAEGACSLSYEGGELQMGPGDWMWMDSGFAHRGKNAPGSNFLTVFISNELVVEAGLDLAPIGAFTEAAPAPLAATLTTLEVLLLDGTPTSSFERPALDALLDYIGTALPQARSAAPRDTPVHRARALLTADPTSELPVSVLADQVGLSASELSRRFKLQFTMSPVTYRKQMRLLLATRRLQEGHSVAVAAHSAGFADAAHLSRTFKLQYGITPSRWVARVARRDARS